MDIESFKKLTIDMGHFTPVFFMFYSFFHGVFFKNSYIIFLSILTWVDFRYIGPHMKNISRKNNWATPRPFCKSINQARGCNGMPSGHTQTMALIFSYILYYTLLNKKQSENYFMVFISFIGFIFMGFQRVFSNMHTPQQVFYGGAIGVLLGPIFVTILNTIGKILK